MSSPHTPPAAVAQGFPWCRQRACAPEGPLHSAPLAWLWKQQNNNIKGHHFPYETKRDFSGLKIYLVNFHLETHLSAFIRLQVKHEIS